MIAISFRPTYFRTLFSVKDMVPEVVGMVVLDKLVE